MKFPHHYSPALLPGIILLYTLVRGEVQFVCIFDVAI